MLRTLEILLMMVAIASLTAFGLLKLDEYRGQADLQAEFQRRLELVRESSSGRELPKELPGEVEEDFETPPEEPEPVPQAQTGDALGRLRSERIGLDVMVAEGVDDATLRRAAGRIPGTARVGELGNVGLAAHRDTFFRPLREIRKGDELDLETLSGSYRYRVDWIEVVEPENVTSLAQTNEATLTLVTCFPFHYVGPAPRRFIVRATRVGAGDLASATRP